MSSDLTTLEERAFRIDGFENVSDRDRLGRSGKRKPTADAFRPVYDSGVLESREKLGEKSLREFLEAREIAHADRLRAGREDEQRVQGVLGAGSVQR